MAEPDRALLRQISEACENVIQAAVNRSEERMFEYPWGTFVIEIDDATNKATITANTTKEARPFVCGQFKYCPCERKGETRIWTIPVPRRR